MIAVVLLVVVAMFGALTVVRGLSPSLAAVDLGLALLVLALMTIASVVALQKYENPALIDRLTLHTPYARLAFATVAVMFIVLVSGVLVADGGSIVRCLGWPLFSNQFIPENVPAWLPVLRHTTGLLATILIFLVILRAWRQRHAELRIWRAAIVVLCSFLAEILIGILLSPVEFEPWLLVAYVVAAAALWTSLVVVTVLAGMDPNHTSIKEAS
jgi:heme A synthase